MAESVAAPRPASLFSGMRALLPTIKLRRPMLPSFKLPKLKLPSFGVKLPSLKLPTLALPASAPTQPSTPEAETRKDPKTLHYAHTPLATFSRVKSRLQDRPPLVAAFADQVSALSPASLVVSKPPESSSSKARKLRTSVLLKNLRDLLPTPVAALLAPDGPRKRSLVSILGGRAAKKVVAEIEVCSLQHSLSSPKFLSTQCLIILNASLFNDPGDIKLKLSLSHCSQESSCAFSQPFVFLFYIPANVILHTSEELLTV